jgi:hypothetical protein
MFTDLKTIVDMLRTGVTDVRRYRKREKREEIVLNLLRMYFLLKDCVDEGESLIAEAGSSPVETIRAMDEWKADATLKRWEATLRRQAVRLRSLEGFVYGDYKLAVINPALQDRIGEVIGYKFERANSLHGIGAALFMRAMFPLDLSNEEEAGYVATMAGSENDLLDVEKAKAEIAELRDSLDQYRAYVERLLSDDEIAELSSKARHDTLPHAED